MAANAGEHYRQKVTQNIPINSPIAQGFKKMGDGEKDSLKKLFDLAYLIAKNGQPYSDFSDFAALETTTEMRVANLLDASAKIYSKQKLTRLNSVTVLCELFY